MNVILVGGSGDGTRIVLRDEQMRYDLPVRVHMSLDVDLSPGDVIQALVEDGSLLESLQREFTDKAATIARLEGERDALQLALDEGDRLTER